VRLSRPPSSWIWLLALFSAAGFAETLFFGQLGAFTPLYLPQLGVPAREVATWTGISAAIASAAGLPFLPFWGALADRYARQPIIVRSFVAHLVAILLMLIAGNIWVFVVGRSVSSLALGNSGLMLTTLSERVPQRRMGLAFAIMNSAPPLGAFVGPFLGGPVVDARGFRALLIVNAALMLLVIVVLTFGYRDSYRGGVRGRLTSMAAESVGIILRSPRLRMLFPALFLLFSGWMMAFTYVPLAVAALYHGPAVGTAVGVVVGIGGLTTLALGPALGVMSDRFGYWRVLLIGSCVVVLLWPLPALARDLVQFGVAWAALNGAAAGVFAISFNVLSGSVASAVRGRVMAFAYLPINVGGLIGPALGAPLARYNVFAVFPVAALMTLAGVGTLLVAQRQQVAPGAAHVSP
jgi:MFS family permease